MMWGKRMAIIRRETENVPDGSKARQGHENCTDLNYITIPVEEYKNYIGNQQMIESAIRIAMSDITDFQKLDIIKIIIGAKQEEQKA